MDLPNLYRTWADTLDESAKAAQQRREKITVEPGSIRALADMLRKCAKLEEEAAVRL